MGSLKISLITFVSVSCLVIGGYAIKKNNDKNENQSHVRYEERRKAAKARFDAGPYVSNEKKISETETLKTIIYPGREGDYYNSMYDTTCYVYSNAQNQSMECKGLMWK